MEPNYIETPRPERAASSRLPGLLTAFLVVPCASVAVLFMLQIEVLHDPQPRRLIAAAAACLAPVGLFLLRLVEDASSGPRRSSPGWFWTVWFLATVGLIAIPIAARLGLGTRPASVGASRTVRDLQVPQTGEVAFSLTVGLAFAALGLLAGLLVARWGTTAVVVAALAAVGVGYATVPLTFVGMALSYDVVIGPGDDPLADAAQTVSIVWFVAAPMAGLLAGWTAGQRAGTADRRSPR